MIEHISNEKIHDLLDGLLSAAEEDRLRSHLDECGVCREEVARLNDVVMAVRALPSTGQAPDGIWEGIQDRIDGTQPGDAEDTRVVAFPGAGVRRRRFRFSIPQLAAAAVVVSVLSAATVWMAISGVGATGAAGIVAGDMPATAVHAASMENEAGYAAAVAELEALVEQGRGRLAPETMAVLDRALQNIDEALTEVRQALETDPSSGVLGRMLVNHQRSRLRLLRQAASAVQALS